MHGSGLGRLLRDKIAVGGSIPFSEFMGECLYHPQFGYYSGGGKVVGREGDFYTSVSTGALFGRLLADGFYQTWLQLGSPAQWQIVEQGANRGELAGDVLGHLRKLDERAFAACSYLIVEPFHTLRQYQSATLAGQGLAEKLRHVATLAELPDKSLRGVFYSNELPDAFPVRRVKFDGDAWLELRVGYDEGEGRFVWREQACDGELLAMISEWQVPALPGYCAEIAPLLGEWVREVAAKLAEGVFLTIDYGGKAGELYTAERTQGTLRAYRKHRQSEDVLALPGEQDLTAQVNFSQLVANGERYGLREQEYTDQHHYLVKLGQLGFFREMEEAAAAGQRSVMDKQLREYKTLMHTEMMGALFKVSLLTPR